MMNRIPFAPRRLVTARRLLAASLVVVLPLIAVCGPAATADDPLDWLYWRGPFYNGFSVETGLIDQFDPAGGQGSHVAWKLDALAGRSSPVVMDGRLYTLTRAEPGTPREGEKVVCVDAQTGKTLWENRFNVYLSDVPDTRVGWSACVADPETDSIFAQGVCGHFQCIDAKTGQTKWYVPLHERFGLLSTYGGRTNFPILHEDLVITSGIVIGWGDMAKPAHRFLGFNKRTGEVVWFSGTRLLPYDTNYSGPSLNVLNGQKSLVVGSGDGAVWSLQPRTGRPIWQFKLSRRGLNAPPLVDPPFVYAGHSEENIVGTAMGALVAIDSRAADGQKPGMDATDAPDITATGETWRADELMAGRTQPLRVGNHLWIFDDRAKLQIFDAATGKQIGRRIALGRMMRSSPLLADGKVYAFTANGRWAIFEPDERKGAKILAKGRLPDGEEVHGSPTCSHGRIYVQSTGGLYCLVDPTATHGVVDAPAPPPEPSVAADRQAAYVQVVPAEVLMKPGETIDFTARLFNHRGQLVADRADATFAVEGPGHITPNGQFTADKSAPHQAAFVIAKSGSLAGRARIRVVPDLPWAFDFDDGEVPVPWVGARYRHVVLDDDLLQQLRGEDPVAAELYIYLHSSFVNSQRPALAFDNSTPAQKWAALQRFLGASLPTLQQAQAMLEGPLKRLSNLQVLSGHSWKELPSTGVQLTVTRGPRRVQGNGVMTKITTIPKGTRSRCWFGQSDLSNYTIQADVRGASKSNKMPDIGLIAQGYCLDLQGENQQLQIRSWVPVLRMARSVSFSWDPERWYTVKFQASVQGDQALLRGKVWPKGTPEPTEWTVEATDDVPNRSGSPGLFGNAKDAELFLDNVQVYANTNAPNGGLTK